MSILLDKERMDNEIMKSLRIMHIFTLTNFFFYERVMYKDISITVYFIISRSIFPFTFFTESAGPARDAVARVTIDTVYTRAPVQTRGQHTIIRV